jgi:hypothetical protein
MRRIERTNRKVPRFESVGLILNTLTAVTLTGCSSFDLFQVFEFLVPEESIDVFKVFPDAFVTEFKHLGRQAVEKIAIVRN